jgi:hypothetical protein
MLLANLLNKLKSFSTSTLNNPPYSFVHYFKKKLLHLFFVCIKFSSLVLLLYFQILNNK